MKKLVSYVKLKNINPFLLLAAAFLFLISLSTITYSWVEGAASVTIKNAVSSAISVEDTNAPVKIDVDSDSDIDLTSYIEHSDNLFLAPATSTDGKTISIYNDALTDTRIATTNDIGNNYIEFDFQLTVDYDAEFMFKDSSITVGSLGALNNPIRLSFSIDGAVPSKIINASEITDSTTAVTLDGGTHIVTVRIWNEYSDETSSLKGQTVNFNLTLTPVEKVIDLTVVDRTNSQSALNVLTGKQLSVTYDGKESEKKTVSSTADTVFTKLPQNKEVTIKAYDNNGSTLISQWILTTPNTDTATYIVFGNLSTTKGLGTLGDVVKLNFYDRSYSGVYATQNNVSFSNGSNKIVMYKNPTAGGEYSCYAPKAYFGADTTATTLYFNANNSEGNSQYYTSGAANQSVITADSVSFTLFGATSYTGSSGDTKCWGQWGNVPADEITFRDRTENKILISATAATLKVACAESADDNNSYLASYIDGEWKMNIPKSTETLVFTASNGTAEYTWDNTDTAERTQTNGSYIYSATAAADDSAGTWQYKVNVTIANAPHAITTASFSYTYTNTEGTSTVHNGTLNEGDTVEVPEGTQIEVKTVTAKRVIDTENITAYGELNGYRFASFTVSGNTFTPAAVTNDDYTNVYSQSVTVGDSNMTVETNADVQPYYLGGSGLKNITQWSGSVQMTYSPESNIAAATVEMSSGTAELKISEIGFTSAYRDTATYSVTLNEPSVNIAEDSTGITSAALSGTGNNTLLAIEGSANTELTVTYSLSTNTITVLGKESTTTTRIVYFRNTLNWSSVGAYMWGDGSNPDWSDTPSMTLVDGTTDIYYIEIENDNYTNVIFRNLSGSGNANQTVDLDIPDIDDENKLFTISGQSSDGKRIGEWSKYPPSVGDTISLEVGIIYYLYETNATYDSYDYILEYSGGTTSGSVTLNQNHSPTNETANKSVGSAYWSGAQQEFYIYTAEIPSDSTSVTLKITNGSTTHTFSPSPNPAQYNRLYGFEYGNSYILYYENE